MTASMDTFLGELQSPYEEDEELLQKAFTISDFPANLLEGLEEYFMIKPSQSYENVRIDGRSTDVEPAYLDVVDHPVYQMYPESHYQNQNHPTFSQDVFPSQPVYEPLHYGHPLQNTSHSTPNSEMGISFDLMTGLAVFNGQGRPMTTQDVYSFIMKYWPTYRKGNSSSWKSCVRSRLSRSELFSKLEGKSMLKSVYILNPRNPGWIQEKIQQAERYRLLHGLSLDIFGLEDTGVWNAMIEGCLGLPPFETADGRIRKRKIKSSEDFSCQNKRRKDQQVQDRENLLRMSKKLNEEQIALMENHFLQQFEQPIPAPYVYQPNEVPLEDIEPTICFF